MDLYKNVRQQKSWNPFVRGTSAVFLLVFLMAILSGTVASAQDDSLVRDNNKGMIINLYGKEMGAIDAKGNVTNSYGTFLGSVDGDGNIFNVSKINIGVVTAGGKVLNQAGTVLGSVNAKGEIFNVSGRKMGEAPGENSLKKAGAAARLIILK